MLSPLDPNQICPASGPLALADDPPRREGDRIMAIRIHNLTVITVDTLSNGVSSRDLLTM
ncbi:MAG: hypothetical protein AAFY65_05455 [Pseudomonadota bacterium]